MKHFTLPREGGLIEKDLPKGILHSRERIPTEIYADATKASADIAELIVNAIRDFLASGAQRPFKLGLSTGRTPSSVYQALVEKYKQGEISFADVQVFSVAEYYPTTGLETQSHNYRMHREFLDLVDIQEENVFIPDGTVPQAKVSEYCAQFDAQACGLDLLVVGIGPHGQIGFNEVGASFLSRTHVVALSYQSRKRQAKNFNGSIQDTPKTAITMGLSTMMSAKRVIMMAWGESKTEMVKQIVERPIDPTFRPPSSSAMTIARCTWTRPPVKCCPASKRPGWSALANGRPSSSGKPSYGSASRSASRS